MRIQWNSKGFQELLTGGMAKGLVDEHASRIQAAADIDGGRSEYGLTSWSGPKRAGANVYTKNPAAMVENAKHNTLLRALGGG